MGFLGTVGFAFDRTSSLKEFLIDIFLPSYCNKKFSGIVEKPSGEEFALPSKNVFVYIQKICSATKPVSLTDTFEMLDIHKQVKHSGKQNFEACRIPINTKN